MLENLVKTFRRRTADESAASAIELAIVLPILLLASLALVDMAFFVANWTGTNAGATSAARTIVVTPDASQDDLKAAVLSDAPQLGASDFEVNVTWGEEKTQEYTHHFPDKTATKFVAKKRNVVTQDVTVTVTAKRPYLTVLGKAWGQSAGTGDDMVAKSSCTMSVDRTNGTNWVGEDNYVPGIRWTLVDGVLTVMPEEGYSWGVGINDGVTAAKSKLSDWVTLTDDEWKTVTEVNFEGSVAFGDSKGNRYCPRLASLSLKEKFPNIAKANLSSWDSSRVTDMSYMFSGRNKLKTLDVSGWNTSSVTDMSHLFYECPLLTSLNVSAWDTSNVTNMKSMFDGCKRLSSLDVSNWDTSKVTDMSNMFHGWCTIYYEGYDIQEQGSLTSLDVSNWDTSNVTNMSNMFSDQPNLTSLDVSGFDTSKVTRIDSMFAGCKSLTSLDVSGFDTSNVEYMWSVFFNCTSLTSLDVSNWDTSNVTNMSSMFQTCTSLTSLDVSRFDTSKVESMDSMFCNCDSLTNLDVTNFDVSNVEEMGYMFMNLPIDTLDLSTWDTSNVKDMQAMFYNSDLTTIYVGDGWTISGLDDDYAFAGDSDKRMFLNCKNLVGAVSYDSSKIDSSMANWETGYLTYKGTTKLYDSIDANDSFADWSGFFLHDETGKELPCDSNGNYVLTLSGRGEAYAKTIRFAAKMKLEDGTEKTYALWKMSDDDVYKILFNDPKHYAIYSQDESSGTYGNVQWKDRTEKGTTVWVKEDSSAATNNLVLWWMDDWSGGIFCGVKVKVNS